MTDSTTTVDDAGAEAVDEETGAAESVGSDVAVGDGGDGTDDGTEFAAELEPEPPIKDRLLIPLLLPWLCIAAVFLYALNVSRIFLAGDSDTALIIGTIITIAILLGASVIASSTRLRKSSLTMVMGFVLVIVVSGGLISLGPSFDDGKSGAATGYVKPKGPPTSTVAVTAGPGLTFNGVAFKSNYTATAGVIEIDYGGAPGHNLVFVDPKLNGFELETSKTTKGNVELKAGTYTFYCNVTGHRAAGMQATLTVS